MDIAVPPKLHVLRSEPYISPDFYIGDATFRHKASNHSFGNA